MYKRFILKNIQRSIKDYLIYILTCTLTVALFYAFLSITSPYYRINLPQLFNMDTLRRNLRIPLVAISILLVFLISYVNQYLLNQKKSEFALQSLLGMEPKTIGKIFFLETIIMGWVAIGVGIILGSILSQFVSIMVMDAYSAEFKLQNAIYPDTILITVMVFTLLYVIVGWTNIFTIRKMKIIDMLQDQKVMESRKKNRNNLYKNLFTVSEFIFLIVGVMTYITMFDPRHTVSEKLVLYGAMIAPGMVLITQLLYLWKQKSKNWIAIEIPYSILGLLSSFFGLELFMMINSIHDSYLPLDKVYYITIGVVIFILSIFVLYVAFYEIINYKRENSNYFHMKYIFLLGQLNDKMYTNIKSMSIITLTLLGGIITLILSPLLSGWVMGHLEERSVSDVYTFTYYTQLEDVEQLPKEGKSFQYLATYLIEKGYHIDNQVEIPSFFMKAEEFYHRQRVSFPVLSIRETDYNQLLKIRGYPLLSLGDDEFAVQWHYLASEEEKAVFEATHDEIIIQGHSLRNNNKRLDYNIGGSLYNNYTNSIFIIPDRWSRDLLVANLGYYIDTTPSLSHKDAEELEVEACKLFKNDSNFPQDNVEIRIRTLQTNEAVQGSVTLKLILSYVGVVLLIICFTILSLQQLTDSSKQRRQYQLISYLGTENQVMSKSIRHQLLIWFGMPIFCSVVLSLALIRVFVKAKYHEFRVYVGLGTLYGQIGIVYGIVGLLLVLYFLLTWALYHRNTGIES